MEFSQSLKAISFMNKSKLFQIKKKHKISLDLNQLG